MTTETKVCKHCTCRLPLAEFGTTPKGRVTLACLMCADIAKQQKKCSKCSELLPATTEHFYVNSSKRDGLYSQCKVCSSQARANNKADNRSANPARANFKRRVDNFVHKAGRKGQAGSRVHVESYLRSAPGICSCEVCGDPLKSQMLTGEAAPILNELPTANLDHCHESGVLRGFLCAGCNTGLGLFKDDPALITKAAAYVQQFEVFK